MARGTTNSWALKDYQAALPDNTKTTDEIVKLDGRVYINVNFSSWELNYYIKTILGSKGNTHIIDRIKTDLGLEIIALKGHLKTESLYKTGRLAIFYDLEFLLSFLYEYKNHIDEGARFVVDYNYKKVLRLIDYLGEVKCKLQNKTL